MVFLGTPDHPFSFPWKIKGLVGEPWTVNFVIIGNQFRKERQGVACKSYEWPTMDLCRKAAPSKGISRCTYLQNHELWESLPHSRPEARQRLSSCEPTHWVKRFCNDHILILIDVQWCNLWPTTPTTLSETSSKSTWKIVGWKMMFLLWWPIFKGCDSFRERNDWFSTSNPMGKHLDLKTMHFPARCETSSLNLFLETI